MSGVSLDKSVDGVVYFSYGKLPFFCDPHFSAASVFSTKRALFFLCTLLKSLESLKRQKKTVDGVDGESLTPA